MQKMENQIINNKQKEAIKVIKKLLDEMHKDIQELIEFEKVEDCAEKIKSKSIRISKIAIVLQNTLDREKGGEVATNLDHLYKHIRFAVQRVMDDNDFSYLNSAEKVTSEINKGWKIMSAAAA
tara:strand:+ start:304 stop:672 length:369 start_codon:yes stop_codon:yes gene_type:complete